MSITRLSIEGLRNISALRLELSAGINLVVGANGSGKSSLLEAIHLLGLGRSFRTTQYRHYLQDGERDCTVSARVRDPHGIELPVGFRRGRDGELELRLAGERAEGIAALAELLPVQLINSDTFSLLEGSPAHRRQFMDWGGFHAEPGFLAAWRAVGRCLRQRNSLLKHGRMAASVRAAWDHELVQRAEELDRYRQAYLDALIPRFEALLAELLPLEGLKLSYYRGWDHQRPLDEVLARGLERDLALGFTHSGPQRADLRVRLDGVNAAERLSRGQQKLVVSALKLAQGMLLRELSGRGCIYLVDDLPAELDMGHRRQLCTLLAGLNTQVLITATDAAAFEGCWSTDTEVRTFLLRAGALAEDPVNGS